MIVSYDNAICVAFVENEISRKSSNCNSPFLIPFRKQADSIYEQVSPYKRGAAFNALYRRFFLKIDSLKYVKDILEEFAGEKKLPVKCFFASTHSGENEGMQLSEDSSSLGVKIKISTLLDSELCAYFLRHELTHITDILDSTFVYDTSCPLSEVSQSEESLFRDRFRTLWDLSVDGRLERKGVLPVDIREKRTAEFRALFQTLDDKTAEKAFLALWNGTRPSNEEFRRMVKGVASLCSTLKIPSVIFDEDGSNFAYHGSPCSLCLFPTHEWAEKTDKLCLEVKKEFPEWDFSQGICSQCANRYLFASAWSTNLTGTEK